MIISTNEQFSEFIGRWNVENSFVDVVYLDADKHACNTTISVILVQFMDGSSYVLPFNHNDCTNLDASLLNELSKSTEIKFCINKKDIINGIWLNNLIDLKIRKYLDTGKIINNDRYYTEAHKHYYQTPAGNINGIIPILKHLESFEVLVGDLRKLTTGTHIPFYNDKVPQSLSFIEKSGLHVNHNKFIGKIKHLNSEDITYTHYNIYTATGRPSNAHGGVNFAALGKSDGSRQGFDSRFEGGTLYQYDYDAFHIRIIANLIDYELPDDSAHMWFAKQYYQTNDITPELYDESKKTTFFALYGDPDDDQYTLDFFKQTYAFRRKLWSFAKTHGYVPSPLTGRKIKLDSIDDVSESKIFNYLLQLLETEHNIGIIFDLIKYMTPMKSKLILYTYDSFLFDVHPDEIESMKEIQNILEDGGKYPVSLETGKTYHSLS